MNSKIVTFIATLKNHPEKAVKCLDVAKALEILFKDELATKDPAPFSPDETAWIAAFCLGMAAQMQKALVDTMDKKISNLKAELLPHLAN